MALLIENYLSEEILQAIGGVFTGYRRSFDGYMIQFLSVATHVKFCTIPRGEMFSLRQMEFLRTTVA